VVNPTPLIDLTQVLTECAKVEYGFDISSKGVIVFGKFDSKIFGGSVKVRPAVRILSDAIATGRLTRDKTVFEATSGNFGLALGMLSRMDVRVVALVSRKLQEGVVGRLEQSGVKMINLDTDVCPAPGMKTGGDLVIAKGIASSVRQQLAEAGLNPEKFDKVRSDAEGILARQDVISLAKLLSNTYDGFCPEQYGNDLNVRAHEEVTGPEIDQQLGECGLSLADFEVVCSFGTGGTATGLSKYLQRRCGRRSVRVVYPLSDQDVAGIRTKARAAGLRFYDAEAYAGEHEADFEKARRLLRFFNERGHDVGESGALVLYECLELINYGAARSLVALIADGASKYAGASNPAIMSRVEVTLSEATAQKGFYAAVVWTHGGLIPKDSGVSAIASSFGLGVESVRVAKAREVQALLSGDEIPAVFALPDSNHKLLLICLAGGTSLMAARALAQRGIAAESLMGGITAVPAVRGRQLFDYLQPAKD
jgi:cysteine synthase/rhodanese-related sulfurtransferase